MTTTKWPSDRLLLARHNVLKLKKPATDSTLASNYPKNEYIIKIVGKQGRGPNCKCGNKL